MRRTLVGLLLAAALVACGGGDDDEKAAPVTRRPTTTVTPTTAAPGPTVPLLGTPGEPPARPALVVKLDNAPLGRPQAGINEADVVVEEAVEGGITRLFAIFHSADADAVGPVRSARSTDVGLVGPLNRPLFAYSGANAAFVRLVQAAPLVDVGVDTRPGDYRRERGRPAPYNLFSSTPGLRAATPEGAGPPGPLFEYRAADEPPPGGQPSAGLRIAYVGRVRTDVEWRWDAGAGGWLRSQNGTDHVDTAGARVAPANVVVQVVPYRDTGFVDQSGEPVPEAELVGEGEALVFTAGRLVRGRWRRSAPEARTEYIDDADDAVRLTPGRTWVELAPPGSVAEL